MAFYGSLSQTDQALLNLQALRHHLSIANLADVWRHQRTVVSSRAFVF